MQTIKTQARAIIGWASFPNTDLAKQVAKLLITNKNAACVKIMNNLESIYEWEGKIEESKEVYLIIKSTENQVSNINKVIKENHPYEVYEFLYTLVDGGNEEYLNWISKITNNN